MRYRKAEGFICNNLLQKLDADIFCDSNAKLFETLKIREISSFQFTDVPKTYMTVRCKTQIGQILVFYSHLF